MDKLRVLVVVGSLRVGGQERIAASIIEYIDKSKFQVDYLVYDDIESVNTQSVEKNGGRIIRLNEALSKRTTIVKQLKKAMQEYGPYDIVHAHGMFNNGYVMLAAKKAGVKCRIAHSHSTNAGRDTNNLIYKMYMKLMRHYMLKYSTSIVACGSQAGEFLFGEKAFSKRGKIFYNRIDSNKFAYNESIRTDVRKTYNLDNQVVFIIVGHLVPLKNHRLAFDAFEKFYANNKNSKMLVLGDGEYKDELQKDVAQKQLSDDILFLGNVNNVNEFMIAADYLLMPSLYEGFPVTLVEAQAAGLKCLVSNTVTKEADITGLITWCRLDNVEQWVEAMGKEYVRRDTKDQIVNNNFDFANYSQWLTRFYEYALQ